MDLKVIRKNNHLSQNDMAKILNTSQSNYSKYERGVLLLNEQQLKLLANHFRITLDELCDNLKPFQTEQKTTLDGLIKKIYLLNENERHAVDSFIKVYTQK